MNVFGSMRSKIYFPERADAVDNVCHSHRAQWQKRDSISCCNEILDSISQQPVSDVIGLQRTHLERLRYEWLNSLARLSKVTMNRRPCIAIKFAEYFGRYMCVATQMIETQIAYAQSLLSKVCVIYLKNLLKQKLLLVIRKLSLRFSCVLYVSLSMVTLRLLPTGVKLVLHLYASEWSKVLKACQTYSRRLTSLQRYDATQFKCSD